MINHHPSLDLLIEYTTGSLSEGVALAIATHASLCSQCGKTVRALEDIGGVLLESEDDALLDRDLWSSVVTRLDEPAVVTAPVAPALDTATHKLLPPPLRRYVGRTLKDLPWRSVGRMFQEVRLPLTDSAMKATLMRLRPGSLMPKHTHRGHEYTLVLSGGYSDSGVSFGAGDFDAKDSADLHQPVVDMDSECLCFVVLDAPVKLTGTVGRLINPFLRF